MTPVFLDYNATSPLRPEAWDIMQTIYSNDKVAYNASSVHSYGRIARKYVEESRMHVATILCVPAQQVIFNSGATEGNNALIHHFCRSYPNDMVLISAIEHPSLLDLADIYDNINIVPVLANGLLCMESLAEMLDTHNVSLVSCMMVSNETGIIQDISAVASLVHRHGAYMHSDCTQAIGRVSMDNVSQSIDFITVSAHKIGGPHGVGALSIGPCGITPTLLYGGGQEKSARAGTENVAGIAGFGMAAQEAHANIDQYVHGLSQFQKTIERGIKQIMPDVVFYGQDINRVANTTFFSMAGTDSQTILIAFDLEGICISNGSACSSGSVRPSHTLMAMGVDQKDASSALRVSTGWATTEDDIKAFLNAFDAIYKRIKKKG